MVWRVGRKLALESNGVVVAIASSGFAYGRIIEPVARVEHNAGSGCKHGECASGRSVGEPCCFAQLSVGYPSVNQEIMVVALAYAEIFVIGEDVAADRAWESEVHGGAFHVCDFAGGNVGVVGAEIARAAHTERLAEHRSGIVAREIEISVVGQIHYRGSVGIGFKTDCQLAVVAP